MFIVDVKDTRTSSPCVHAARSFASDDAAAVFGCNTTCCVPKIVNTHLETVDSAAVQSMLNPPLAAR
jgi:hypothetical protein